jgi:hypothetical protein
MTDFANAAGYALKHWSTKLFGDKPSPELLKLATYFAKGRPGNNTLCLAMAMRPEGVTSPQMVSCVGDVKHNHRRDQIEAGLIAYDPEPAKNEKHHLVYHVVVTAKGQRFIDKINERTAKAEAKAAEALAKAADKANGKGTPGKGKPVKPTSEPAKVIEGPLANQATRLGVEVPDLMAAHQAVKQIGDML